MAVEQENQAEVTRDETDSSRILVAVVGTSDVQISGEELPNPRAKGEIFLDVVCRDRNHVADIDAPIIEGLVTAMADSGERPGRIVLIGTDQGETHPMAGSDTLYFAELVKEKLQASPWQFSSGQIQILLYKTNPADYDAAFTWMKGCFNDITTEFPADATHCHLALTGGTPQLTAALLFQGTSAYGDRARAHYKPVGGPPRTLDVAAELDAETLRRRLLELIDAHAYAAAQLLVTNANPSFERVTDDKDQRALVLALLKHGASRLNADLTKARDELDGVSGIRGTHIPDEDWNVLLPVTAAWNSKEAHEQAVRELIASASVMLDLGHYFDFITRVGALRESLMKYILEFRLGAELKYDARVKNDTFSAWVMEQSSLRTRLDKKQVRYRDVPTLRTHEELGKCLTNPGTPDRVLIEKLNSDPMNNLSELRNDCVHDFSRIRLKMIEDKWGDKPDAIIPAFMEIAQGAGITVGESPYPVLQETLKGLLK